MPKRIFGLIGAVAMASCASSAYDRPYDRVPVNLRADHDFLQKAASLGTLQVESSQLAMQKEAPRDLARFAQDLERQGARNNQRLEALAESKGERLPARMLPEEARTYERLERARGDQFDDLYRRTQVIAQENALQLYEHCASVCQDLEVREYASTTLPTLRRDLRRVQELSMRAERREPRTPYPYRRERLNDR